MAWRNETYRSRDKQNSPASSDCTPHLLITPLDNLKTFTRRCAVVKYASSVYRRHANAHDCMTYLAGELIYLQVASSRISSEGETVNVHLYGEFCLSQLVVHFIAAKPSFVLYRVWEQICYIYMILYCADAGVRWISGDLVLTCMHAHDPAHEFEQSTSKLCGWGMPCKLQTIIM